MLIACILLFFISSCGRKSKDVFSFAKQKVSQHKKSLELSAVRNVKVTYSEGNILVSWDQLDHKKAASMKFIGYYVYRLRRWGVIPKSPLNKNPIKGNRFEEKSLKLPKNSLCYAIRAVYKDGPIFIYSPISKIS